MVICILAAFLLSIYHSTLDIDSLVIGILGFLMVCASVAAFFMISMVKTFNRLEKERGIYKSHRAKETCYLILYTLTFGSILFLAIILITSNLTTPS